MCVGTYGLNVYAVSSHTAEAETRIGICTCSFTYVCGYEWFICVCGVLLIPIWLKVEWGFARVCLYMYVGTYACLHMYVGMCGLCVYAVFS